MFTPLKEMAARLRAFARSRDLDRDFEEELESHVSMLTEDNLRRGVTPEEARRAAVLRVGGLASIREQHREVRGLPAVDTILQDLRFAFRLIAREPWFSAVAIGAMALGIGVNAIGFTVVNAAFFRGLPFANSTELHVLTWQNASGRRTTVSHAELQDWREQSRALVALAAFSNATMNVSDDRAMPEQAQGAWLTANTFSVLRQQPLLGRDFSPGEDRQGAEPVVIIGYSLWKNRYGANPNVLGQPLRVNGRPATIIGVMPDGMKFPENTEVWAPFIPTADQERRSARLLNVFGRLRDGVSRAEAQSELNVIGARLTAAYPDAYKDIVGVRVETFPDRFVGGLVGAMLVVVMGAVCFVLLIACANVANLLLSRSAYRAREIAVRMALGATRRRIVGQLLLESVVLSVIGGSLGLLLAVTGVRLFDAAMPQEKPYWIVFTVDYVVIGYVAAMCVLTAVLFGLAPALHVSKTDNNDVLKEGARGTVGSRRVRWMTGTLVVAELALTVILLAGAGLMFRSFLKLYSVDLGLSTEHLMTLRLHLPASTYTTPEARLAFFERLEPRLAAIAGVSSVAVTTGVPPLDGGERLLEVDRGSRTGDERPRFVSTVTISPRFFEVISVPLLRGRGFTDRDGSPGVETVIINERLAAQFFPDENPIGRRIRFTQREPAPGQPAPVWRTIVGISPSIRTGAPEDAYLNAVVYVPYRQEPAATTSLILSSLLPPGTVMDAVRREVQAIDRDQPVFAIQTVEQVMAEGRWPLRVFGSMFAVMAAIALALSSIGLYAVLAYSVTQRTQEIGVRMALGAQARQVSWLVLKRGLGQLAIGLTLGLAGALALSRVVRRMLVGISPADPVTFAAITILLTIVAVAACLLPARRATQVDPLVALRAE